MTKISTRNRKEQKYLPIQLAPFLAPRGTVVLALWADCQLGSVLTEPHQTKKLHRTELHRIAQTSVEAGRLLAAPFVSAAHAASLSTNKINFRTPELAPQIKDMYPVWE